MVVQNLTELISSKGIYHMSTNKKADKKTATNTDKKSVVQVPTDIQVMQAEKLGLSVETVMVMPQVAIDAMLKQVEQLVQATDALATAQAELDKKPAKAVPHAVDSIIKNLKSSFKIQKDGTLKNAYELFDFSENDIKKKIEKLVSYYKPNAKKTTEVSFNWELNHVQAEKDILEHLYTVCTRILEIDSENDLSIMKKRIDPVETPVETPSSEL